jgi:arabinogalactan oligomer/maltooligosaccharide transport system permease protein
MTATTDPAPDVRHAAPAAPNARRRRTPAAWLRTTGWRHVVGIVVAIYALLPIAYVLSTSLNPTGTLTGSNRLFSQFSFASYGRVLTDPDHPFGKWFLNSLGVGVATAVGTVFLGALAAYSFSDAFQGQAYRLAVPGAGADVPAAAGRGGRVHARDQAG